MARGSQETTTLSLTEAARRAGVTTATLRRWVEQGVVPLANGRWTPAAAAHARIVARLRERGHSLEEIRTASDEGRLAFGYVEELLPALAPDTAIPLKQAARETGLEPALIERLLSSLGYDARSIEQIPPEDVELLRLVPQVLDAGFPLVALLQLMRVYGQALAHIADAEVRLFHLYVHEPLMRDGLPGLEMAEQMEQLGRGLLPLASAVDGSRPPPLPAALRRAGHRSGTWRRRSTARSATSAGCASRSRSPTSPATRDSPRRWGRRRRSTRSSASSTRCRSRCPTTRGS